MADRRESPLLITRSGASHCDSGVRRRMLARTPFFADLSAEQIADVDRRCRARHFDTGDRVYSAGDRASEMFVVAAGAAKSQRGTADGRETLLHLCGPGDFLGAVPALGEDEYPDSAWALAPTCLLGLDAAEFTAIAEEHPVVALAALRVVSKRLSDTQNTVHLLAAAPLDSRIAATLLGLSDKVGRQWRGATLLEVPLSRDDLAAMTGSAPESVSRVLSAWRTAGHIDSGRRWIAVRDHAALQRIRG